MKIPAELFAPLAPVEFPNGRELRVFPITNWAKRVLSEKGNSLTVEELRSVMKVIVPDMTDADWDCLTESAALWIVSYASGQAQIAEGIVEEYRKNVSGGIRENASGTPPLSQMTPSASCAPESPEPTQVAADTSMSNVSPITRRSSRSTRSRKSSGSTDSSPISTP